MILLQQIKQFAEQKLRSSGIIPEMILLLIENKLKAVVNL